MGDLLLPIFPLKVVLFPGMNLPLHIFEERYKRMIGECIEFKREFGIVLAHEDAKSGESSIASMGCSAIVDKLIRKYPDGRMDIVVRGMRRFEVLDLNQADPLLRGTVLFFDDEEGGDVPASDTRRDQAVRLCDEVMRMIPRKELAPGVEVPDRASPQLAYEIVAQMPVALNFRQALLEMRGESERLNDVIDHLTQLKAFLAKLTAARVKAGSNGQRGGDGNSPRVQ